MSDFTHFDEKGNAIMVDVSGKSETERIAVAEGKIKMSTECYESVKAGNVKKGDVLAVARIAGIMALKRTDELIPLCHTLLLQKASIEFQFIDEKEEIYATCTVKTTGSTGVEMEALTGVTTALLTIYDMCKAIDKKMELTDIRLLEKHGGKSGFFRNDMKDWC